MEKWSTGSSVSSSSEISTETQQTNQSAGVGSTASTLLANQNTGISTTTAMAGGGSRPGSAAALTGAGRGGGGNNSLHNTSQVSVQSRHSALSMSTHQTLVSPPPISPLSTVFKHFSPDIIQNHCDQRKNVSFSDDLSVSQVNLFLFSFFSFFHLIICLVICSFYLLMKIIDQVRVNQLYFH